MIEMCLFIYLFFLLRSIYHKEKERERERKKKKLPPYSSFSLCSRVGEACEGALINIYRETKHTQNKGEREREKGRKKYSVINECK